MHFFLSSQAYAGILIGGTFAQQPGWPNRPPPSHEELSFSVASTSPFALQIHKGDQVVQNAAILVGASNDSVSPVSASTNGKLANEAGQITTSIVNAQVARVTVNTTEAFVGARFSNSVDANFYGLWEYPWSTELTNNGIEFDLKGLGDSDGINWDNARAPFFFTSAGYGVYADSQDMSSWNFSEPGTAEFIFNSSSLVYYIILPAEPGGYKSILTAYAGLSNTIEMQPDSGYGPTFWSDNFEQDFHAGVTNAQENYYDVVNHLYYNQIHATSMFADRPYGTGNMSWGNFDFDPTYYPSPEQFIANLSAWGFDFQVWTANRAFLDTELYNVSVANKWLFPGISPGFFPGPALNLSIPAAYDYFKQRLSYFTSIGVKGYKIDRGEEGEMPVYEQDIQNPLFEQLCYENMVEKWGEGNFWDFSRSAYDRSRSKTAIWNGDSHSNFSGLAYSVTSSIRAGLIGYSQWASDTGGYIRGLNDPTEELWARWMWFSAFSPVYEIMIGTNHTPWYPPYTEDLVTVLKETANLHHDLLPYIKSHTYQAHQNGLPVIRAPFLEYPKDTSIYTTTDAYFFGSEFYVAPIVNSGGQRSVYFPQGTKYLEYFNKTEVHQGGTTISVSLSTHAVPAYVKEGAIVPRGDIYQGNNKWTPNWTPELTVELYPSDSVPCSTFTFSNGANITMNFLGSKVTVEYGALGINGTFVLYAKAGPHNETLHASGGSATFGTVQSIFEVSD
jgi:alpha-D-xyloside xylohydrolase